MVIRKGSDKHDEVVESYNAKTTKTTPLIVAPLDQQDPYESNRAWQHVIAGIAKGNMDIVGVEKSKIENVQRELRRKEQSEGRQWQRRFFTQVEGCPRFDRLAKVVGEKIEKEKTGGVWRFDDEKAKNAKPPYHAG